jgi:uncharacterized protein YjbJ (UPF0337 family)
MRSAEAEKFKEVVMKEGIKDEMKGKLHQAKGKVKEKVGSMAGKPDMEYEGKDEQIAGKVQEKVGQVERVLEK